MADIKICDMCHQQIEYKKLAFLKFRKVYYHGYGETYADDNISSYDLCIPCYNKIKYFIKDQCIKVESPLIK